MPLSLIVEIPDVSLNEKLVPANDNHAPTALSVENFEAGSVLAPRNDPEPSWIPLVVTAIFFITVITTCVIQLVI